MIWTRTYLFPWNFFCCPGHSRRIFFEISILCRTFVPAFEHRIELWCNGNTTDSGPVILGSNPGSSTEKARKSPRFFHSSSTLLPPPEQPVSQCETNKPRFRRISALSPTSEILISKSEPYSKPGIKNRQSICTHTRFPSCFTRSLTLLLYCTGDMKNSSGIVQGAGYTRKSDASGKSVRI